MTETPTITPTATPCDPDEPGDDIQGGAAVLAVNGASLTRLISKGGDEDWFTFNATGGQTYTLTVNNVGANLDPILFLTGNGPDITRDFFGRGCGETLSWTASVDGPVSLRITDFNGESGCSTYEYDIGVTQP